MLKYSFLITAIDSQSAWANVFIGRGNTAIQRNCCLGELCQSCVCECQYLFLSLDLPLCYFCDSGGRIGTYSLKFGFLGAHVGQSNPLQKLSAWAALLLQHNLISLLETLEIKRSFKTRCLFLFKLKSQKQSKARITCTPTQLARGGSVPGNLQ